MNSFEAGKGYRQNMAEQHALQGGVSAATARIRSVEAAAFSSWPAPQQVLEDGWLLRFGGGHTKRANSANPLYRGTGDADKLIDTVERAYRRRGLPAIFRLTPLADIGDFDRRLDARGYRSVDPSRAMVLPDLAALPRPGIPAGLHLSIDQAPNAAWLAASDRLQPIAPAELAARQHILDAIAVPAAYATLYDGRVATAVGLATVSGSWFGLYCLITDEAWRGRGLMRALIGELGAWARSQGAEAGQLFVIAGNAPAERLYQTLGYCDLYRYHYRVG
jgi:GNAT superfamily N-acetyltransferase